MSRKMSGNGGTYFGLKITFQNRSGILRLKIFCFVSVSFYIKFTQILHLHIILNFNCTKIGNWSVPNFVHPTYARTACSQNSLTVLCANGRFRNNITPWLSHIYYYKKSSSIGGKYTFSGQYAPLFSLQLCMNFHCSQLIDFSCNGWIYAMYWNSKGMAGEMKELGTSKYSIERLWNSENNKTSHYESMFLDNTQLGLLNERNSLPLRLVKMIKKRL